MADIFLRKVSSNVGTVAATVGNYTVSSNTGAILIGLTVANTSNVEISANVSLYNGSADYYLIQRAPLPAASSLVLIGGEQKLVLQSNDSIRVSSSISNSIDVIMTLMESSTVGVTVDGGGGDGNSYTTGVNLTLGGTGSTSLSPLVFDTYFMPNQPFANEWVVNRQFRVDRLTQSAVYRIDVIGYVTDTDVGMVELTKISGDDIIGVSDFTTNTTFTFLLP